MPKLPMFTESELATAFAWLLSDEIAKRAAREWFEQFATDIDEQGHFLYQDWHEIAGIPAGMPDVVAVAPRGLTFAELFVRQAQSYAAMSTAERLDYLMSFSDFHLSLVSLVSPEAAARIGRGRGMTPEQERNALAQMRVIVAAMRQTRGAA